MSKIKKFLKNRFHMFILCILCSTFLISAIVYAVPKDSQKNLKDSVNVMKLDKIGTTTYEEWKIRRDNFNKREESNSLTKQDVSALYDKGYSLKDIEEAEALFFQYGGDVEEILAMKDNEKTEDQWGNVKNKLNKTKNKIVEVIDENNEKIKSLMDSGYTKDQINKANVLAMNYGLNIEDVLNDLNNKSYDELDKDYWKTRVNKIIEKEKETIKDKNAFEERLKKKNQITEQEIKICNENGITEIFEILYVKNLANKYNTSLEQIVKLKNKNLNWNEIDKELEESKR